MPNLKNAKKRVLVNVKKEKVNNEYEASMKTAIKNVEREVIATTAEPNIQVQLLGDGKFYVKVADEDGVASISINLNGEILSLDNINQKEVQTNELTLREGLNTVSITVTNVSGYTKTQAADIKYPY